MTDALPIPAPAGVRSRLLRLADRNGIVLGVALDHRDALLTILERKGLPARDRGWIGRLKARLAIGLGPEASLLLLDAEYGRDAIERLPGRPALVMPLEAQGYERIGDGRVTRLLSDFRPADAAALGADACKLLLPYRVDDDATARLQDEVAARAIDACHAAGLPLVLEPIVYRHDDEPTEAHEARFGQLVIEGARRLAHLAPDLLKLQYPAVAASDGRAACEALDAAAGRVPWVLLGAGSDARTFARQLEDAASAGASGFIVGRTLWEPALAPDEDRSEAAIREACLPTLRTFAAIAGARARSLREPRR